MFRGLLFVDPEMTFSADSVIVVDKAIETKSLSSKLLRQAQRPKWKPQFITHFAIFQGRNPRPDSFGFGPEQSSKQCSSLRYSVRKRRITEIRQIAVTAKKAVKRLPIRSGQIHFQCFASVRHESVLRLLPENVIAVKIELRLLRPQVPCRKNRCFRPCKKREADA